MLLTMLATLACGQAAVPPAHWMPRGCRDRSCWTPVGGRGGGGGSVPVGPPQLEFATASGIGMGSVCAGTAVTGTLGETVTFSRPTPRTCLKGPEVIGIQAGDMVTLAVNQPAAMYGGDGTGALGLSRWPARTNWTMLSQQFDSRWAPFGTFNPTVSADQGNAPDGTKTADRVTFPATTAGQSSFIYQDSSCRIGIESASVFVAAWDGGSGNLDMCFDDGATGWKVYTQCVYGLTADGGTLGVSVDGGPLYTRCLFENFPMTAEGVNMLFAIGHCSNLTSIARNIDDVLLWGAQCETGLNASPYIATGADAGVRAAEVATINYTASGGSIGYAATYLPSGQTDDFTGTLTLSFDALNSYQLAIAGAKDVCSFNLPDAGTHDGGVALNAQPQFLVSTSSTTSCEYTPNSISACGGGYCKSYAGAAMLQAATATVYLGGQLDGGGAEGTIKNVCIDPSSTKCRSGGQATVTCPSDEPSTVAMFGDSIMVGAFQVKMLDEINDELCPAGRAAVNFAVSGSTIADCQTQYTTSIKGHAYRAVATDCGINTLNGNGDPAASWAQMKSLLDDVVLDGGFHVVLGNLTPCRGYSICGDTDYTNVATFNTLEALWCADAGSRATCLDNNTLLGTGSFTYIGSPASSVTTGFLGNLCTPSSDSLHPNNYCTTKLAHAFAGAIP